MASKGAKDKPTKFLEEPPALICPICRRVFTAPVISVQCGHTFCRPCIDPKEGSNSCPLDGIACESSSLVVNKAVIGQIDDLSIYCCYGIVSRDGGLSYERDPAGCPEVLKLGSREEHERSCTYAHVRCPLGGEECGIIRTRELDEHVLSCPNIPCPYTDFGCAFKGNKDEIVSHKAKCVYHDESQLLALTMKELKVVKVQNKELEDSLTKAIKSVNRLNEEKKDLYSRIEQQSRTITTVTSRMDKLEAEMESFKSVKLRQYRTGSMSGASNSIAGAPGQYSTQSHSPAPLTTATHHPFQSNTGDGNVTPVYPRRTMVDPRRWSSDSYSSVTSLTVLPEAERGPFVWRMPFTLKCIGTFRGHKGTIWSLVTSGDCLFSGSSDGTIKVWDIADLRRGCLKTVQGHKEATMFLAVGRGILYSTGTDLSLKSWQLGALTEMEKVENAHEGIVSAMLCTKDYVITSSFASIKFWDPITLNEIHSIGSKEGLSHWIRAMAHDKRKDFLYTGSHNKLHVWKVGGNFSLVNEMGLNYGAIYSLAVTKKYLIVGTHNQNIQVYSNTSLNHVATLTGHIGSVTVLKVTESQAGVYMFSGSSDYSVQVWDLENMLPIQALKRHEKAVQSMAVWYDAVFTGSEDEEIKVFKYFKL
ncbi:PREDICTED: E3 ubiquitin-protein ligase TRAF7-like [Amphimedon queenslandica]|uniref:RING-type domain-containing protein n=2 Tax=Amphimedon queenslandica TaxID=400682 RepID=A0A1X7VKE5_AMPQE|nr:PREDICTED: E3 ubiquitin-protein ligase TRAF7-like [Amphimedon queenslandica]|eukprot:XP_003383841.1 PREDICTED: E3 ubiquitin-protein ligase TRAF7-like [Amphimedon queenslandica]